MAIIKFKSKKNRIFQFRIDIKGAKPPIWRRVQVKEDITFRELHHVIQECFDWLDYHLHQFSLDDYSAILDVNDPYHEPVYDIEYDEYKIKINEVFKNEGEKIEYEYDFGDDWVHTVKLEKILEEEKSQFYPYLVTGKRGAPVEDCGGIWGWEEICELMTDPKNKDSNPEIKDLIEEYGDFDPYYFDKDDIQEINKCFEKWEFKI